MPIGHGVDEVDPALAENVPGAAATQLVIPSAEKYPATQSGIEGIIVGWPASGVGPIVGAIEGIIVEDMQTDAPDKDVVEAGHDLHKLYPTPGV